MFKSTHASTGHCWSIGSIAILITDTAIPIHQTNVLTGVKKSREKIINSYRRGSQSHCNLFTFIHLSGNGHSVCNVWYYNLKVAYYWSINWQNQVNDLYHALAYPSRSNMKTAKSINFNPFELLYILLIHKHYQQCLCFRLLSIIFDTNNTSMNYIEYNDLHWS